MMNCPDIAKHKGVFGDKAAKDGCIFDCSVKGRGQIRFYKSSQPASLPSNKIERQHRLPPEDLIEKCNCEGHAKCILELGNSLAPDDTLYLFANCLLIFRIVGNGNERPLETGEKGFSAEAKEHLTVGS